MRKTRFNGVISPATALDAANIQNRKVEPAVSVIIPIHNGAATIEAHCDRSSAQSLVNWEAIIIDDASSDKTMVVAQEWNARDGRFRVARLTENRGSAAARNAGLRIARGEFVAYLDDDDEFYPDYLQRVAGMQQDRRASLRLRHALRRRAARRPARIVGPNCRGPRPLQLQSGRAAEHSEHSGSRAFRVRL